MANEIGEIWDLPTDRIHLFMFSIQTSRKSDLILTNDLLPAYFLVKSLEQIINLFHIKFKHLQQFRPNRTRDLIIYVHLQLDGSLLTPVTTDKA